MYACPGVVVFDEAIAEVVVLLAHGVAGAAVDERRTPVRRCFDVGVINTDFYAEVAGWPEQQRTCDNFAQLVGAILITVLCCQRAVKPECHLVTDLCSATGSNTFHAEAATCHQCCKFAFTEPGRLGHIVDRCCECPDA